MLTKSLLFIILLSKSFTRHIDLRETFADKRKQNNLTKFLDEMNKLDKISSDGIPHYRKEDLSSKDLKKILAIENDFRRLISMEGFKYIYKRDMHWRTFRRVNITGVKEIVSYKCNNQLRANETGCEKCGLWTIEEIPPCPLEFYSMIDNDRMCVYDYLQPKPLHEDCPAQIKFNDLPPSCDNPMETNWRFTTEFNSPKKFKSVICDGKDYCEIFTTYLISPADVKFKIVNLANQVIYSRIMKTHNINYICIDGCGIYDTDTKKVTKLDIPMKLTLLSSRKNKRDIGFKSMVKATSGLLSMSNKKKGGKKLQYIDNSFNYLYPQTTTMSSCRKLQKQQEIYQDYNDFYDELNILQIVETV